FDLLATTDLLSEGIHFNLSWTSFYDLGVKAVAANVSDIAAMGGTPTALLIALSLPPSTPAGRVDLFYRGVLDAARPFSARLAGGDTTASLPDQGVVVCVTALGEIERGRALTRSGAEPGDLIFVSGTLGDAAGGLELLTHGTRFTPGRYRTEPVKEKPERSLVRKHLHPVPRVALGRALAQGRLASAAIDVSDGLLADLGHIAEESGAAAVVETAKLPVSPALRGVPRLGAKVESLAAAGGEDYELLFTARPEHAGKIERLARKCRVSVAPIGKVGPRRSGTPRVQAVDARGRTIRFEDLGYEHFRTDVRTGR
ncbi:MAG: thiamine-phosphate kinase, partial [Nitrospirae bacterium]|nr:thiamine-phosphate kinase [Nitrospirota bacterium]